jgi:hypothetical protein
MLTFYSRKRYEYGWTALPSNYFPLIPFGNSTKVTMPNGIICILTHFGFSMLALALIELTTKVANTVIKNVFYEDSYQVFSFRIEL